MLLSSVDNQPLPLPWQDLPQYERTRICRDLMNGNPPNSYRWKYDFTSEERLRVTDHVLGRKMSQKSYAQCSSSFRTGGKSWVQQDALRRYIEGARSPMPAKHVIAIDEAPGMLYPKPNGGQRILPSVYTQISDTWLKADKTWRKPYQMNFGHLENCIKLLKESHGNAVAKSTDLLGKLANHFSNSPHIVAKLQDLCLEIQKVEVDEMYPIFQPLSEELVAREQQEARAREFDDASWYDGDITW